MAEFDFAAYMQNVAIQLKDIGSTADNKRYSRAASIAEIEEFLSNSSNVDGYHLIAVTSRDGRFINPRDSFTRDQHNHAFYIVKSVPADDFDKQELERENTIVIAKKVVSRLFRDHDANAGQAIPNASIPGLKWLDRDSFVYHSISNIGDNFVGIEVMFTRLDDSMTRYVSDDWNDS